jgi:hypothetical protein
MWSPNESLAGEGDDRVAPYVGELGNRHFGAGRHHAEPDRGASLVPLERRMASSQGTVAAIWQGPRCSPSTC